MEQLTIHGIFMFLFTSYDNWGDTAKLKFSGCGYQLHETVCIDAGNNVCTCGGDFKKAMYPVKVYRVRLAGDKITTKPT